MVKTCNLYSKKSEVKCNTSPKELHSFNVNTDVIFGSTFLTKKNQVISKIPQKCRHCVSSTQNLFKPSREPPPLCTTVYHGKNWFLHHPSMNLFISKQQQNPTVPCWSYTTLVESTLSLSHSPSLSHYDHCLSSFNWLKTLALFLGLFKLSKDYPQTKEALSRKQHWMNTKNGFFLL